MSSPSVVSIPSANWDSPCLQKLDALDWKFGFCLDFDGSLLGVRTDDPGVGEALLSRARGVGRVVEGQSCDSLVSFKVGSVGGRRGVKNFHLLYSEHYLLKKTLVLDELLQVFDDYIALSAIKMTDYMVHVEGSRLFAWQTDDRMISVIGAEEERVAVVVGLMSGIMHERAGGTPLLEDGRVAFSPMDLNWRGRSVHHPLPLTDLVFLVEPGVRSVGGEITRGEALVRLYNASSGKVPKEKIMPFLASALANVRCYALPVQDLPGLGQQVSDLLGLGFAANTLYAPGS